MNRDIFWDRIGSVKAGMLAVEADGRMVPMTHNADADQNTLWFISAQGNDLVTAAETGPMPARYVVADGSHGLYAHLNGALSLSNDRAKLEALWNLVADSWFEGGKDDPDVRLLAFRLDGGEVWATTASGVVFLFQVAKARVTGAKPDGGTHFTL
jgi:general stress protein 26